MHYRVIAKHLGIVAVIVAAAMTLSLPWAFPLLGACEQFEVEAFWGLLLSAVLSAALGGLLFVVGRRSAAPLLRKETMAIVGLSWILASGLGALPFLLGQVHRGPERVMNVADALFESASGFSGTGATVITDLENPDLVARSMLFWRAETHFLGGLGIMVLFVAFLGSGSAGKALMRTEMPGPTKETGQSRTQHAAWVFATIYLVLNAALILLLLLQGMSPLDAVCHSFATIATGGFSNYNDSVGHFQNVGIEMTIAVFMVLACTNFTLLYLLALWKPRQVLADVELRVYLTVLVSATLLVVAFGMLHTDFDGWCDAFRYGFFQVASILTNTGFTTHNFDQWNEIGRGALFLLMFVGGCAGSTSCSVKIIRHVLFAKILWRELERAYRPSVVRPLRIGKATVEDTEIVNNVLVYFALLLVIFVVAWFALDCIEPDHVWSDLGRAPHEKLVDIASGVGATINGVGPGLGTIGAIENYSHFHPVSKILFVFLMLLGRLELYVILVLFLPRFWRTQ